MTHRQVPVTPPPSNPTYGDEVGRGWRLTKRVTRPRPHKCRTPGWWARRRLDLDLGSEVRCAVCGDAHRLEHHDDSQGGWTGWVRIRTAASDDSPALGGSDA